MTFLFLICSFLSGPANLSEFLSATDQFLKTHVQNGSVAYETIKEHPESINALYSYIENADPSTFSTIERKSFYINAYNIIVIYQVSKYYPLKSPLDASGFFDAVKHQVGGQSLTLNQLEIKKLLSEYQDARIHFVLACAAKSCPQLGSFAYTPDKLDEQLEARTVMAINDPTWLMIDPEEKKVKISKIFQWYEKDFNLKGESVRTFINTYRKKMLPESYKLDFYEYNWALNDK